MFQGNDACWVQGGKAAGCPYPGLQVFPGCLPVPVGVRGLQVACKALSYVCGH